MNLFYLNPNSEASARNLCDKHVPKMLLETCQMLSTAVRNQVPHLIKGDTVYKTAYPNHPMTKWVGDSYYNFMWAFTHAKQINAEYNYRFGKIHKSERILDTIHRFKQDIHESYCKNDNMDMTTIPQCMPDQYKNKDNPVEAYRNYYFHEKKYFAKWEKGRSKPYWFIEKERLHGEQ